LKIILQALYIIAAVALMPMSVAATSETTPYPNDPVECLFSLKQDEKDRLVTYALDDLQGQNLENDPKQQLSDLINLQVILCSSENSWPSSADKPASDFLGAKILVTAMAAYLEDNRATTDQLRIIYDKMDKNGHRLLAIAEPDQQEYKDTVAAIDAAFAQSGLQLDDTQKGFARFALLAIDLEIRSEAKLRAIIVKKKK
jgi:hypothetical protein